MSTSKTDIPEPDWSSDPEDPEYYEKCLADYEKQHEDYCEAQLYQYLNGPASIEVYALREEQDGPTPRRRKGHDNGK